MRILAIESSCDETAAAVIEDGRTILSSVVDTQIETHALYGGVVPEIASRRHMEAVVRVTEQALADAKWTSTRWMRLRRPVRRGLNWRTFGGCELRQVAGIRDA